MGFCKYTAVLFNGEQTVLAVHFVPAVPWKQKLKLDVQFTANNDID